MKLLGILLLTLLISCEKRLFQPETKIYQTPDKKGFQFEESKYESKAATLVYWHLKNKSKQKKGTLLHFHGNSHNISYHYKYVAWLTEHGYDVFVFDYPQFGKSKGDLTKKNIFYSSLNLLDHIYKKHQEMGNEKFFVMGQSLGGNMAMSVVANSKLQNKMRARC